MMIVLKKSVLILLCILPTLLIAQRKGLKFPVLQFQKKQNYFSSSPGFVKNNSTSLKEVLKPFDNAVHYSAFFCNMELVMHERCNIWIKVHAGDYDTYSK